MSEATGPIVCVPHCGYLSETTRMAALHTALQARGLPSLLASHGGAHEHVLDWYGAGYERLEPRLSPQRSRRFVADTPGIGSPKQSMWSDDELRTTALAEAEYLHSIGATAVVTGFQLTTLLSARLAGIPVITSHAGSWVAPVMQRGLVPAPQRTAPLAIRRMPRPVQRFLANRGALRYRGYTAGFNRVARELGVERIPSLPALLSGDLTLVTEAPELLGMTAAEFLDWRPPRQGLRPSTRMHAVGPLFAQLPLDVPPHVGEFLRRPGDVAYVALTSTSADVVERATAAVRRAGLRALVVTTVHDSGGSADGDVLRIPLLPSQLVMPRVRVAVVTGGQGSVQTALASGTPFAGIPLQPEQEWNVSVAERAGAARSVVVPDIDRFLTAALQQLLGDDRAVRAARRVAEIYAGYDAPAEAAHAIEAYLTHSAGGLREPVTRHRRQMR